MLVTVCAGEDVRKVRLLEILAVVLLAWQSQGLALAEDYVPNDYVPKDYVPGNAAPPSPPPNLPYIAPNTQYTPPTNQYPTGNPQYPAYPGNSSGMLQGQVEQSQKIAPLATPVFPGYLQQQQQQQQPGTTPGGLPYAPWQFGNPMQARPAVPPQQFFPLATQQAPLQGQVQDKNQQQPKGRPTWLPAYAYSNDAMVAPYHNLDIFFWDKRAIPNRKQWMKLSTSVSRYWNGYVPDPCMILAIPIDQAPGNFTFSATEPGAPRGWLQNTGDTNWQGFPMYRYWFDPR